MVSRVRTPPLGKRWMTSSRIRWPSKRPRTPRPLSAPRSKARSFLLAAMRNDHPDKPKASEQEQLAVQGPPLEASQLLEQMHLITPDGRHVYRGFKAFRWMAWRLPFFWPLAPFLYIPGIPALGQRLYLWVARNRFHLVP